MFLLSSTIIVHHRTHKCHQWIQNVSSRKKHNIYLGILVNLKEWTNLFGQGHTQVHCPRIHRQWWWQTWLAGRPSPTGGNHQCCETRWRALWQHRSRHSAKANFSAGHLNRNAKTKRDVKFWKHQITFPVRPSSLRYYLASKTISADHLCIYNVIIENR